ncbi:MAG: alpha-L-fucosidase [Cyclobacteriaceae bacterium]|nr:alpha-L-fucosidase [Cyclobacteriaceae bacterium]
MKTIARLFLVTIISISCTNRQNEGQSLPTADVTPTPNQLAYQKMETVGFVHFTVNTFTDKEWGYGDEDPSIFAPTEMEVEQWVKAAHEGGLRELILTAKHHDGFCLWPSQYTEHSVKNSPYKDGQGDVVREFVDACRKYGLKAGLYLSPWDRNHADYGKPAYLDYYRNQLVELLTQYGEINEIWFDGANGGDGYYGGANEIRKIDNRVYYEWDSTFALVKSLQPDILIFSDAGPDIRWVGNEHGHAGETFWSTIHADKLVIGGSDASYLNTGEADGANWLIGQCDVSIRPGWFYHASQDSLVKTPLELIDIYYKSVGRNGVLLLNLPPDTRGLIHENDVASLRGFKNILEETFRKNFASGKKASASNYRMGLDTYSPEKLLDDDPETFWATDDEVLSAEIIVDLTNPQTFDRLMLCEPIRYGQRIRQFEILSSQDGHVWEKIAEGSTIGYKRLIRTRLLTASLLKIRILNADPSPALHTVGIYLSSEKERTP